jgi:long-chain acyl-CoA synthetase
VKPGERVALWLRNCPHFIPALFGVLQAGAVVAPINNFLKADEVSYILLEPEKTRAKNDLAIIIYTSGTTGRPKGAMLSHGNLLDNVESCRQVLRAVGEDRFVVLLPMFHSFMLCVGIALPMLIGGSMVLIKSVNQPKSIVEEIIRRKATLLPAVPQFFRTFTHPSIPRELPLRVCISGGAPLPGEILREFTAKFPFALLEGYGLSEASPVCTFNPFDKQKPGSIGKPIPNVEVSVQDDEGRMLKAGETGEICIRGSNVMLGYWNQPRTKTAISSSRIARRTCCL